MSHIQIRERREALGSPHRRDYERSMDRKAQRGHMPESLDGLMHWFAEAWAAEVPSALHASGGWHVPEDEIFRSAACPDPPCDHVVDGKPVHTLPGPQKVTDKGGGSVIGTPAYNGAFRAYIENSHSQVTTGGTDEENGYYLRPVHKALSSMTYGRKPLTARCLFAVAQWGFDWRAWAASHTMPLEMAEMYLEKALSDLWSRYTERSERAA